MAVSVPYRGATFLNGEPMFTLTGQDRFPSPIGELHFSIEVNNEKTWRAAVSVPYRGATFLNILLLFFSFTSFLLFPSPIGELHFSMRFSNTTKRRTNLFPSPIGELHFSIVYLWKLEMEWKWCFRPLSGSYISQSCFFISLSYSSLVSVPYRGATFLNTLPDLTIHLVSFPSPIGELHFSIKNNRAAH